MAMATATISLAIRDLPMFKEFLAKISALVVALNEDNGVECGSEACYWFNRYPDAVLDARDDLARWLEEEIG